MFHFYSSVLIRHILWGKKRNIILQVKKNDNGKMFLNILIRQIHLHNTRYTKMIPKYTWGSSQTPTLLIPFPHQKKQKQTPSLYTELARWYMQPVSLPNRVIFVSFSSLKKEVPCFLIIEFSDKGWRINWQKCVNNSKYMKNGLNYTDSRAKMLIFWVDR